MSAHMQSVAGEKLRNCNLPRAQLAGNKDVNLLPSPYIPMFSFVSDLRFVSLSVYAVFYFAHEYFFNCSSSFSHCSLY